MTNTEMPIPDAMAKIIKNYAENVAAISGTSFTYEKLLTDFYRHLQADKPKGMSWVKASDRLPIFEVPKEFIHARVFGLVNPEKLYDVVLCNYSFYKVGRWWAMGPELTCWIEESKIYEWLDESQSPDLESANKEIERLKEEAKDIGQSALDMINAMKDYDKIYHKGGNLAPLLQQGEVVKKCKEAFMAILNKYKQ